MSRNKEAKPALQQYSVDKLKVPRDGQGKLGLKEIKLVAKLAVSRWSRRVYGSIKYSTAERKLRGTPLWSVYPAKSSGNSSFWTKRKACSVFPTTFYPSVVLFLSSCYASASPLCGMDEASFSTILHTLLLCLPVCLPSVSARSFIFISTRLTLMDVRRNGTSPMPPLLSSLRQTSSLRWLMELT